MNAREFVTKYGITGGAVNTKGNLISFLFSTTAHGVQYGFSALVNNDPSTPVPELTPVEFIQLKAAQVTRNPSLLPWADVATWDSLCTPEDTAALQRWMGSQAMWADFLSITSP